MRSVRAQTVVSLRDLILRGDFAPGEQLPEVPLSQALGVSRTPVRAALGVLAEEGLIETSPSGGYVMRQFTEREVRDAIAVRGHLEGMAARLVAEHGVSRRLSADLKECLDRGARVVSSAALDYAAYTEMNDRFHALVVEAAGNAALTHCLKQISHMPFAAPSALVPGPADDLLGRDWLHIAHFQHHMIVQAMEAGQGARAQALAEEHVAIAQENLTLISGTAKSAFRFPSATQSAAE